MTRCLLHNTLTARKFVTFNNNLDLQRALLFLKLALLLGCCLFDSTWFPMFDLIRCVQGVIVVFTGDVHGTCAKVVILVESVFIINCESDLLSRVNISSKFMVPC